MPLQFAYYGNPILRKKAEPVKEINEEIKQLVRDMVETMYEHNGQGLAAPQVSYLLRLFIVCIPLQKPDHSWEYGPLHVFINPKIIAISEEKWNHTEGCLSIPTVYGDVIRPLRVTVRALDLDGNEFTKEFQEMEARCILHENDHINGVLFIDRIKKAERKQLEPQLRAVKEKFASQIKK